MADVMKIEITLTADMQVSVSGNIENKMMALGLLEVAKEAVNEMHKQQQSERRIAHPPSGLVIPRN